MKKVKFGIVGVGDFGVMHGRKLMVRLQERW